MKRFLKIMACSVLFFTLVGVMSSCKESFDIQAVYTALLKNNNLTYNEIDNLNDYLLNHKVVQVDETKTIYVSSKKSVSDGYEQADNKAKADFESCMSRVDENEIKAFIKTGKYFTYQWVRNDVAGGQLVVCEWRFVSE